MTIEWNEFDAIELNTVCFWTESHGDKIAAPVHGPEDWRHMQNSYASDVSDLVYSVYGHVKEGGVRCLCDCASPADARAIGRAFADAQGYTVGGTGLIDNIYVPGDENAKAVVPPRPPLDVLRNLVHLAESQMMPIRTDEGDPLAHNAKSTDYFGEFTKYYDNDVGTMASGHSIRICWPELAALIDEANASIARFGATTASI